MSVPAVECFRCPTCGADTPLVGEDSVVCIYCGKRSAVPPRMRIPLQEFRDCFAALRQSAFAPPNDPGQRLSLVMSLLMTAVVFGFLVWWVQVTITDWSSVALSTFIVLAELVAMPVGLLLLTVANRDRDNYFKSRNVFANLRFDVSAAGAWLSCPRCGGPIDCREVKDIVVRCSNCRTDLLIPSVLLADQLRKVMDKVLTLRSYSFDPYVVRKWILVALTAFNGIFPVILVSVTGDTGAQLLLYLTGFCWSYMVNWICSVWALCNHGIGYAIACLLLLIPLPAYFLLMMVSALLGH